MICKPYYDRPSWLSAKYNFQPSSYFTFSNIFTFNKINLKNITMNDKYLPNIFDIPSHINLRNVIPGNIMEHFKESVYGKDNI